MSAIRILQLAFIICCIIPFAQSAEPNTELPKALTAAKEQGKPVFIYVYDSI